MTRFFKPISGNKELEESINPNDADLIEIYWNFEAWAVPMVLSLKDALQRFNNRLNSMWNPIPGL